MRLQKQVVWNPNQTRGERQETKLAPWRRERPIHSRTVLRDIFTIISCLNVVFSGNIHTVQDKQHHILNVEAPLKTLINTSMSFKKTVDNASSVWHMNSSTKRCFSYVWLLLHSHTHDNVRAVFVCDYNIKPWVALNVVSASRASPPDAHKHRERERQVNVTHIESHYSQKQCVYNSKPAHQLEHLDSLPAICGGALSDTHTQCVCVCDWKHTHIESQNYNV